MSLNLTGISRIFNIFKKSDPSYWNYVSKGLTIQTWVSNPNHSVNIVYYTGVESGNPSGSTSNIKTVTYVDDGGNDIIIQTLTYSAADLLLTVTAANG